MEPDPPKQFDMLITMQQESATSVGGESRLPNEGRKKGWMHRFLYGVVPQRGRPGSFAIKEWFQKRKAFGNWYSEKVVDEKTGELIHECHEPLDEHLKSGSAKLKNKNCKPRCKPATPFRFCFSVST
jgi:hypothetical protein